MFVDVFDVLLGKQYFFLRIFFVLDSSKSFYLSTHLCPGTTPLIEVSKSATAFSSQNKQNRLQNNK